METICDHLLFDHKRCDDLFDQVEACVDQNDWDQAQTCFQQFHEAFERHIQMEEQVLLPAFEQFMRGAEGPIALLRNEHRQIVALISRLSTSVMHRNPVDFLLHSETFTIMKQQHSIKEEEMLYPLLDRLPASIRHPIIETMREQLGLCTEPA